VLLSNTGAAGAAQIAETVRAAVQALDRHHVASPHHIVTVSIGVACASERRFATLRALVNGADAALYEAKGAGRNRVAYEPAGAVPDPSPL